jgi:hypothetical protein
MLNLIGIAQNQTQLKTKRIVPVFERPTASFRALSGLFFSAE